jgi:plasmid maintenance system antidote protein VapI
MRRLTHRRKPRHKRPAARRAVGRDWTVAPGEVLREWRQNARLGLGDAAKACRLTPERYLAIEAGDEPIGVDEAIRLAMGTQIAGRVWLAWERRYRADLAAGRKRS